MICKKCKKEISEEFRFCPYCGSKSGCTVKPSFTNAEFLTVCPVETFAEEFDTVKKMNTKDAQRWLLNMHDPVTVYGIRARYTFNNVDDGKMVPRYTDDREDNIDNRDMEYFLAGLERKPGQSFYTLRSAWVCERNLTKSHFKELGNTLFFTKSECEKALAELKEKFIRNPSYSTT